MEDKRKYLEYFDGAFDSTVAEKLQPENWPYVAYSKTEGIAYTVIPEELTSAYQMIDLGLPSGLKWADRNIGAYTPQDNGAYFSWGNVDGHAVDETGSTTDGYSFDSTTYSTTLGGLYTGSTLDTEHDAATANMGEEWRMPTKDEILELVNNTDHYFIDLSCNTVAGPFDYTTHVSNKGLDGSKLRSICFVKKGEAFDYDNRSNFIEFPFAGKCEGSWLSSEGTDGYVLSNSIRSGYASFASFLGFSSTGSLYGGSHFRYIGRSVRGVHA